MSSDDTVNEVNDKKETQIEPAIGSPADDLAVGDGVDAGTPDEGAGDHPMILCDNLVKIYKTSDLEVVALQGLDLTIEKAELSAIIGNSGSGKSSLLNIIGGLDRPSAGTLLVDNRNLLKFTDKELMEYRRNTIGFVWQNSARNLIPYLTALENIEMPMLISGNARREWALRLLDMVGLSHRKNNRLNQLSGGEQQRIAIAIGLANQPKILLADEPTGSVDTATADHIMDVFRNFNQELEVTIIIVTHDRQLARKVDRVVAIRDGRTSSEFIRKVSYQQELQQMRDGLSDTSDIDEDEATHEELAVLDRVGRVQIPEEYIHKIGLKGKGHVKIEMDDDRIVIINPANRDH
jgi:ABC-type lipoprotein export system ATPase subunit